MAPIPPTFGAPRQKPWRSSVSARPAFSQAAALPAAAPPRHAETRCSDRDTLCVTRRAASPVSPRRAETSAAGCTALPSLWNAPCPSRSVRRLMIRSLARLAAVAVALVLASAAPSPATTVVRMTEADLAAQASAVVLGRVTALESHWDAARGQIFTDVTLAVEEVLAGPALPARVTLRQPAGPIGAVPPWGDGSPGVLVGAGVPVFPPVLR